MNPEVKAKWVAALKSRKYQQGQTFLRMGDQYCCLGVLCDLFQKEHAETVEWEKAINSEHFSEISTFQLAGVPDQNRYMPPMDVLEWAGLTIWPVVKRFEKELSLPHLNDGVKLNFNEIAYLIETQL